MISYFWVRMHEKRAYYITVAAPSLEAAKVWAENHGMDFIYDTLREHEEVVSTNVDSVEETKDGDLDMFVGVEVRVDAAGETIPSDYKSLRFKSLSKENREK